MNIEFTDVCKSFGEKKVLADISFVIPQGKVFGIMGESGSGKTTIANLLAGILRPDSGEINGPGGTKISMVFQDERLLPWFSAAENIRFICKGGKEAVRLFEDKTARLSRDLNLSDSMDKNVASLSGGMQRRLSILRALAAEFDLLILDEAFKGLDDALKYKAMDVVIREAYGKTIVLITHVADELEYFAGFLPVIKYTPHVPAYS